MGIHTHHSRAWLALSLTALAVPQAFAQGPGGSAGERGIRPERPEGDARPRGQGRPEAAPRGVRTSAEGADTGYTLFTPLQSKNTYLVDAAGETVHTWASEYTPGNSAYLLEDGSVLRCAKDSGDAPFRGGGEGGRIQRIAWDGTLLWDYPMANTKWRQHHDIAPMPNGHVLAIAWEGVERDDARRAGRDAAAVSEAGLWPDAIIELAPDGLTGAKVVWEWHAWDHLVQDRDEYMPSYGDPAKTAWRIDVNFDVLDRPKTEEEVEEEDAEARRLAALGYGGGSDDDDDEPRRGGRGARSDWMHTNSIDYDPVNDLIAISVREASEVWIIDHSTTTAQARTGEGGKEGRGGDLLYRFGNPSNHGSSDPAQLFHQHDARFVHVDGALHITVFNNGSGRPGGDRSSVDEYKLPFTQEAGFATRADGSPTPATQVWTWNGGDTRLYNGHISGAQRLANGSTLMCLGEEGRTIEVSATGEILWDWLQPVGNDEPGRGSAGDDRGARRGGPGGEGPPDGAGGPPFGGPPEGGRPEGGPPEGGPPEGGRPEGGPPEGARPGGDGPPNGERPTRGGRRGPGGPDGRRGPRGVRGRGGPGGGGGGGPRSEHAVFRVTRYPSDFAGLSKLTATTLESAGH